MSTVIIQGHPYEESFCSALADSYQKGLIRSGEEVHHLKLHDISFDPILHHGYSRRQELEPDLVSAMKLIENADHLVLVYPVWWGTVPAILKGFFDRLLLPGFAYERFVDKISRGLMKGKTAELLITMNSPGWYHRLTNGGHRHVTNGILGFCGIKTIGVHEFNPVKTASEIKRASWLHRAEKLGYARGTRRLKLTA